MWLVIIGVGSLASGFVFGMLTGFVLVVARLRKLMRATEESE